MHLSVMLDSSFMGGGLTPLVDMQSEYFRCYLQGAFHENIYVLEVWQVTNDN